jgi:3',5'-cyclic AMP phosphodiesterase CpdA
VSRALASIFGRFYRRGLLFLLPALAVSSPLRFAVIGDRTGGAQPGIYEQVVEEIEQEKPEFVISVGDQIEGYTEDTVKLNAQWREYGAIVSGLTMPLYLIPGNHDIATTGQLHSYLVNAGQPFYSFDRDGAHFVVLDASRWESSDRLPSEQLDWLAGDLKRAAKARYTFVFYHRPYWDGTTSAGSPDTLHKLFLRYGVDVVFAGHYHRYSTGTYDGIKYTIVGSSGGGAEPGPTGILYHHLLVEADSSGIKMIPVLLGGERRRWDDVTDADIRSVPRSEFGTFRFAAPVVVGPDLRVSGTATVTITNSSPTDSLRGTLVWDKPAAWEVAPEEELVGVAPDTSVESAFHVRSSGRLFPVPKLTLDMAGGQGGPAQVTRRLWAARVAQAVPAASPPVIDGRVDDQCWREPQTRMLDPDGGPVGTDSVRFYFAYDSADLYLAAVCFDPAAATLRARASGRDGAVAEDDCVGYLFQPDTGKGDVFHVLFNPAGAVFDEAIGIGEKGVASAVPAWDGDYTSRTLVGDRFWSIEVRVQLPVELVRPVPGMVWGLNFQRRQPRREANADWQPMMMDARSFGLLLFR